MSTKDHRTEYDAWYSSTAWRKRSRAQRQRQPLCEDCLERGLVIPAEVADHIEPHKGDWNAFRLGALRSLCKVCHDSNKKRTEVRGYSTEIGLDGWPTDPRHPAYAGQSRVTASRSAATKPHKQPLFKSSSGTRPVAAQPAREGSNGTIGSKSGGQGGGRFFS